LTCPPYLPLQGNGWESPLPPHVSKVYIWSPW
jgi:hypothetical protein